VWVFWGGFFRWVYPKNPPGFLGTYPGVWTLVVREYSYFLQKDEPRSSVMRGALMSPRKVDSHTRLRNKRKPPRGMYMNSESLMSYAASTAAQADALLKKFDADLIELKCQVGCAVVFSQVFVGFCVRKVIGLVENSQQMPCCVSHDINCIHISVVFQCLSLTALCAGGLCILVRTKHCIISTCVHNWAMSVGIGFGRGV